MTVSKGQIISLKDKDFLEKQKIAGEVVKNLHREFFKMIKGMSENLSLRKLGDFADDFIKSNNCTPTFYNYNGFPSVICTSINKELVHGFSNRDIILKTGDIIKIDVGVTYESSIADCAMTFVYGKTTDNIMKLLLSCQESLYEAIDGFKPGNRIGIIGNIIYNKSKKDGFGVIDKYGGHGIDYDVLHAAPFISNKSKSDEGIMIQPGMSIAIEPMFVLGKNTNTKVLNDKWTVITKEIGVHFEHSVTLDENGKCHIITDHGISVKDFIN